MSSFWKSVTRRALALRAATLGSPAHRRQRRRGGAPVAALESRTLLAAITINSLADNTTAGDGLVTLREAIIAANTNVTTDLGHTGAAGLDTITFSPGLTGTISLTGGQLEISETVTITGNGSANMVIDAQQNSRIFDITGTAGDVTLSSLMLKNGRTTANYEFGGAIRSTSSGTLTVSQSTLSGNSTAGNSASGGAISSRYGAVTVSQNTLSGNSTTGNGARGGAISSLTGAVTVTVSQSTLSGNSTAGNYAQGGAISSLNGAVTVSQSTLSGNSTTGNAAQGGAIFAANGAVTVSQSTLSGNSTTGNDAFGGAIASPNSGNVTITNSTLSGNQVLGTGARGGGALYFDNGDVVITNSTITGNSANIGGGIGINDDDAGESLTIRNSIIAGNTAATNPDFTAPGNPGTNLIIRNSLIGDNDGTTLAEAQTVDGNGNFVGSAAGAGIINPLLGPLQDNDGPTFTHALLIGSLALNSGNNTLIPLDTLDLDGDLNTTEQVPFDQRGVGFARIESGTVDMGALENVASSVTVVITMSDTALIAGETALVTFTFSEAVTGFTNSDLTIANGTLTAVATANGGLTWTATFTPTINTTDATNVITLNKALITDLAGNAGAGISRTPNYAIDTLRPTVVITMADTALKAGETSLVTFTFNEAVTGFTNADFVAIANGTLTAVVTANGGLTWTATFTPTINLTDTTNLITLNKALVTDLNGNAGSGTASSPNYAIDTLRPTVTILMADNSLTVGETSLVTFTFNEAVTGFTNADFVAIANGTLTAVASANGGLTWTATFTPTINLIDTTNLITLNKALVTDLNGNAGSGTASSNNYAINTI